MFYFIDGWKWTWIYDKKKILQRRKNTAWENIFIINLFNEMVPALIFINKYIYALINTLLFELIEKENPYLLFVILIINSQWNKKLYESN